MPTRSSLWVLLLGIAAAPGCAGPTLLPDTPGEDDELIRICADGPVVRGVDVSHYQGFIDWTRVHNAGKVFAFMKATEGTTFADPEFAHNWRASRQAGLLRGAYHFFHAGSDPLAQADFFLDRIDQVSSLLAGDLPPVVDIEGTSIDGEPSSVVANHLHAWLQRVENRSGRRPIIYTGNAGWTAAGNPSGFAGYPLWVANYGVSCPEVPGSWQRWRFWQTTSSGSVAGIAGNTDLDVFNGTLADLRDFINPPRTPPADAGADAAGRQRDGAPPATDAAGTGTDGAPAAADAGSPGVGPGPQTGPPEAMASGGCAAASLPPRPGTAGLGLALAVLVAAWGRRQHRRACAAKWPLGTPRRFR